MKLKITFLSSILLFASQVFSQSTTSTKLANLRRQLNDCKQEVSQLTNENTNLHSYQKQLVTKISDVRDSLNTYVSRTTNLTNDVTRLSTNNKNLTAELKATTIDLNTSQDNIKKAYYEIEILQNPLIVRVYDMDIETLRQALISRLSEASLGFQFDEDASRNQFKITKSFDGNAEAWWVFDKTIDVLLEMTMRIEPHQYDKNKTLVYNSTNLLEKVRFSNKQFALQEDADKTKLYQDKAMRVLEANIRKIANK